MLMSRAHEDSLFTAIPMNSPPQTFRKHNALKRCYLADAKAEFFTRTVQTLATLTCDSAAS